jgi:hypothetical protein
MKKRNIKTLTGIILTFGSLAGMIICGIAAIVFAFKHPDMTEIRRFLEYPDPTIWAIICFICCKIGADMLETNNRL